MVTPEVSEVPKPTYYIAYRGHDLAIETDAGSALARVNPRDAGWTIRARIEHREWRCWPAREESYAK